MQRPDVRSGCRGLCLGAMQGSMPRVLGDRGHASRAAHAETQTSTWGLPAPPCPRARPPPISCTALQHPQDAQRLWMRASGWLIRMSVRQAAFFGAVNVTMQQL